ncbi:MAG: LamG domain-containing protein [Myxococcales bacterium]|nr:LamG domain-containing protein [Myxococcales bacterium]
MPATDEIGRLSGTSSRCMMKDRAARALGTLGWCCGMAALGAQALGGCGSTVDSACPASCDDQIACTTDVCDAASSACLNLADHSLCESDQLCGQSGCATAPACMSDGDCDDASFCNGEETCAMGQCKAGVPPSCDDAIDCTTGTCDEAKMSCTQIPDHAACGVGKLCSSEDGCVVAPECQTPVDCSDGIHCNGFELCDATLCVSGAPPSCDDKVDCTVDLCEEASAGCAHVPNDAACPPNHSCDSLVGCKPECTGNATCGDASVCNGIETCIAGGCEPGTALSCLPYETCVAATGCSAPRHSLSFDGVNDIAFTTFAAATLNALTIEAWVRDTKGSGYRAIVQTSLNLDRALYIYPNGELGLYPCDTDGMAVPFNTWTHVAASWDGLTLRYYVNGVKMNKEVTGCSAFTSVELVYLGAQYSGDGESWKGEIDDARFWNVARTDAEIAANMAKTLNGKEAGLIGYWPLDAGSGNIAIDYSPSGYNGQLGTTANVDSADPLWSSAVGF